MTYVVIPAKGFSGAKQRLSALLQPHERARLAQAMLTDTLTACRRVQGLTGVGVVTSDRTVATVVESLGAEVLWQAQARGHSQAVAFGARLCMQRGIATLLTLPADVPLLTAADVETVTCPPAPPMPVVLVPNRDELGTNALLLSPPDCLPFAFGHDSFQRHLRLAAERHLAVAVRRLPRLALDIDAPEDLALFVAQQVSGQSLQVLAELGILARLHAFPVPPTYENTL